ncbi:GSCFA domain-containing protein [Flavobacteriaceae bacterium R38]|nr:GSCFA domain-containing protein [Flavobacteriaceae bacterium R38]
MNFNTTIPLQAENNQIDYNSQLFLLGSCFSEHIGNKLQYYKFRTVQNPFGIIFHPRAIEKLILKAVNDERYTAEDIFELNGGWHCFDAHSRLSTIAKDKLLQQLNDALQVTNQQIHNATHIIITLGTAWVYRYIETDNLVANCHKVPQKKFLKELLSIDEIVESLEAILAIVKSVNSDATFIFTVSPVRHLKDGFIENQLSKSHLIAAIHQIVDAQLSSRAQLRGKAVYFPSYEIMMDELRDYRFYKEDLIHPNSTAIDYIWEKFQFSWIDDAVADTLLEVGKIQKGLQHRPFNPESEQHVQFLNKLEVMKSKVMEKYPHIKF